MMSQVKFFLALLFTFTAIALSAQFSPVTWNVQHNELENGTIEIIYEADIAEGWVIYGLEEIEDGPIPTSMTLENVEIIEDVVATSPSTITEDPLFMVPLEKFKKNAKFKQIVKPTNEKTIVTGYVTFMTCDGSRCLPPTDIDFTIEP